jgi:hypothetical protein
MDRAALLLIFAAMPSIAATKPDAPTNWLAPSGFVLRTVALARRCGVVPRDAGTSGQLSFRSPDARCRAAAGNSQRPKCLGFVAFF